MQFTSYILFRNIGLGTYQTRLVMQYVCRFRTRMRSGVIVCNELVLCDLPQDHEDETLAVTCIDPHTGGCAPPTWTQVENHELELRFGRQYYSIATLDVQIPLTSRIMVDRICTAMPVDAVKCKTSMCRVWFLWMMF